MISFLTGLEKVKGGLKTFLQVEFQLTWYYAMTTVWLKLYRNRIPVIRIMQPVQHVNSWLTV